MIINKINQLIISFQIETYLSSKELITLIKARISELDQNLELTTQDIFLIICQEFNLDADFLKEALSCQCPFALIGFINELELPDFLNYSLIIEDLNTHSQNVKQPPI
ncbi:MAG: hypothetical protein RM347_033065 [Nostoc sp. ChiQUE02]|uniref:hypothetical protein n=1 Tax=Nostoc sp. ChiQUE02 TaxID=3075377 RepID=UPI002AD3A11D|nr:hypothetical protein [Nostoc sp. ChiQUE02]MDZ8233506.1 hypothetical protein [Nostoc sp. ChiQUE02]